MAKDKTTLRLSEIELALLDAMKSLALVIMASAPGAEKALATCFESQMDGKLQTRQPDAAAVFALLLQYVRGPGLQAEIRQLRQLHTAPPAGRG